MNKLWPSVACSAVFLSGCMYGSATAPITALNGNSNGLQQSNQFQANRAPVGRIQMNRGQTVALTPTRVPAPRPAMPVAQPQQAEQGMVVQAQSPYGQYNNVQPTQPQPNNNDGWSVTPQAEQAPQSSTVAQAPTPDNQRVQNTVEAKPVRPPAAETARERNAESTAVADAKKVDESSSASHNTGSTSTTNQQQVASATPPQQPAAPAKEETAVSTLLKKASASLGKGDLDGAAAYLENAQRIEPQNAKILYDIANIRYHQGRYKEAETFAGRAVQVGGGKSMMKKSWALVANARKSLGDNQGAIAAAEKVASLGN